MSLMLMLCVPICGRKENQFPSGCSFLQHESIAVL
jgi:hypothetical protein